MPSSPPRVASSGSPTGSSSGSASGSSSAGSPTSARRPSVLSPGTRCAAHPGRPAVDACPVCARPRCGADAERPGCAVCADRTSSPRHRPPTGLERAVRAALAGSGAAVLGGTVAAQYVGAELFAYLTPLVVGVVVAAAASSASAAARTGPTARTVRIVACVYGVLGVALGFVLEGSVDPLETDALLPYAAALAGAVLWTLPPSKGRSTRAGGPRGA